MTRDWFQIVSRYYLQKLEILCPPCCLMEILISDERTLAMALSIYMPDAISK